MRSPRSGTTSTAKEIGSGEPMPRDPIGDFFAALAESGQIPGLEGESATVRVDVVGDSAVERWHIKVTDGAMAVRRRSGPADVVVRGQRPDLEALVAGRANAQATLLRGALTCEGNMAVAMMFQRCLPGPPGSTGRVAPISSQEVTAERRRT